MTGVSGVSSSSTAELVKILEESQQATVDLAEKIIKVANAQQVSEAEATGLGQAVDLYA
ncbi:MAG: hypothetical protein PHV05_01915 [Candidatus Riflebacteria bacterium]|nr:hypothetical protein [Candidatus Riflebacteria bacterium]